MKKSMLSVLVVALGVTGLSAQVLVTQPGSPVARNIGVDTAQQQLREISISRFEDAGFWNAHIPLDSGLITLRRLEGGPAGKTPIEGEEEIGLAESDRYVLGTRTEFFRRGGATITITPVRPLAVEGIVKTLSVWVVGRNFNHVLRVMIEDMDGRYNELTIGRLNFSGWRRMTVAIPPTIRQRDRHYVNRQGIKILGFIIECNLMETYGSFYFYMDDLRAVTDLFGEANRDVDDMIDTW